MPFHNMLTVLLGTAILLLVCTVVAMWKEIGEVCCPDEGASSEADMSDALTEASSQPRTSESAD